MTKKKKIILITGILAVIIAAEEGVKFSVSMGKILL
mgnify:CR=1 FL=1